MREKKARQTRRVQYINSKKRRSKLEQKNQTPDRSKINSLTPKIIANTEFPIIITGYTSSSHLGDYYKRTVVRLVKSCIKYDLRHMVFPLNEVTAWVAGCSLKPIIILHAIQLLRQPILWLDADAEIYKYPQEITKLKTDLALCQTNSHWLTGTLYITPNAIDFIKQWVDITKPSEPDEITLLSLYRSTDRQPSLTILPHTYNDVVHAGTDLTEFVIGHHMRPDVAASRGVISTYDHVLK